MHTVTEKLFLIPEGVNVFYKKALAYANTFPFCVALANNSIKSYCGPFPNCIAWANQALPLEQSQVFASLKSQLLANPEAIYGYLGYELKNEIYPLHSSHPNGTGFPNSVFFSPEVHVGFTGQQVQIRGTKPDAIFSAILGFKVDNPTPAPKIVFRPEMSKVSYLQKVEAVRNHILEGDCYELNLCQQFTGQAVEINPAESFEALCRASPAPFAAYFKAEDKFIISASPERFLKKIGNTLISQPIKGTAKRSRLLKEDEKLKAELLNSEKERAENMMIVDLVRNDLARSAVVGSVKVPELFKIYSFPQVHQMISTVTAQLSPSVHFIDALKWAFPMGSMTGAPKQKVMQLIEAYELNQRGPYSGALGYISPAGNFDFNVLIRSLFYNASTKSLSFQVGGAITWDSVAEDEYQECLLKASGLLKAINGKIEY